MAASVLRGHRLGHPGVVGWPSRWIGLALPASIAYTALGGIRLIDPAGWIGPPSLVTGGPPAPGVWWWMILAPIFLGEPRLWVWWLGPAKLASASHRVQVRSRSIDGWPACSRCPWVHPSMPAPLLMVLTSSPEHIQGTHLVLPMPTLKWVAGLLWDEVAGASPKVAKCLGIASVATRTNGWNACTDGVHLRPLAEWVWAGGLALDTLLVWCDE